MPDTIGADLHSDSIKTRGKPYLPWVMSKMMRVGLTLEEIGEALATLPDRRTPTKADWHRLSQTWRPRLDEQIRRLELLRDRLEGCIGCGVCQFECPTSPKSIVVVPKVARSRGL